MTDAFLVSGVRVTHDRADVAAIEAASVADPDDRIDELLERDGVTEAAVVQTCNRVEEYVAADSAATGRAALSTFPDLPEEAVVAMDHAESLRHLLRVAAGLESQVLGEDQILGQVRDAYALADERGALGDVLEPAFLKAIHVGERARTETAINEGTVSLGSAAIDLAAEQRGLVDATVAVIGAGEMARTVAKSLPDAVAGVRILNRSTDRAERLAAVVAPPAITDGLDAIPAHLADADVVFSVTASDEPILDADAVAGAGETLLVDLAQPRDVTAGAADHEGVTVRDLDGLRTVTETTHEERKEAAREVEADLDAGEITVDAAEAAVDAARFRASDGSPGSRGIGSSRASLWGGDLDAEFLSREDETAHVGVMIENDRIVDDLDDLVALPGLDFVFLGPGDLSHALGHPLEFDHPEVVDVVDEVEATVRDADVCLGGVFVHDAAEMLDRGYDLTVLGSDYGAVYGHLGAALSDLDRPE